MPPQDRSVAPFLSNYSLEKSVIASPLPTTPDRMEDRMQYYRRKLILLQIRHIGRHLHYCDTSSPLKSKLCSCIHEYGRGHKNVVRYSTNSKTKYFAYLQLHFYDNDENQKPLRLHLPYHLFRFHDGLYCESPFSFTGNDRLQYFQRQLMHFQIRYIGRRLQHYKSSSPSKSKLRSCIHEYKTRHQKVVHYSTLSPTKYFTRQQQQQQQQQHFDNKENQNLQTLLHSPSHCNALLYCNSPSSSTCGDFCLDGNGNKNNNDNTNSSLDQHRPKRELFLFRKKQKRGRGSISTCTTASSRMGMDESSPLSSNSSPSFAQDGSSMATPYASFDRHKADKTRRFFSERRVKKKWYWNPSFDPKTKRNSKSDFTVFMNFFDSEKQQLCKYQLLVTT